MWCVTPDCGRKVENRDLGLCATCNKARRVSERPVAVKPVYEWKRAAPLAPVSTGHAAVLREKKKAYAVVDKEQPHHCVSCGGTEMLTHSHVLPEGNFKRHRNNPDNILLECQKCHQVWEHNKREAHRLHASWDRKMAIIEQLEPQYLELLKNNFPECFEVTQKYLSK
jgi:hypothetical protein